MTPGETDETLHELAPLYALGTLGAEDAGAFREHLAAGCASCQGEVAELETLVGLLGHATAPMAPPANLRARLLERLAAEAARVATIVRTRETSWQPGELPGLSFKELFSDPSDRRSARLIRLEAGTAFGPHEHRETEEVYVLDGDFEVDGRELGAGDFCGGARGSAHGVTASRSGCTLFVLSSESDQPRPDLSTSSGVAIVLRSEGSWRVGAPGVHVRRLYADQERGTTTALVRMDAGAAQPTLHPLTAEQLYMLEGDALAAGLRLGAGDFYRAASGGACRIDRSEEGCTFLVISSRTGLLEAIRS